MFEIANLEAGYGKTKILHGVSLRGDAAEIISLLGRNGAGKSTTLKTVMGLLPPLAGAITLDGAALTGEPSHRIARRGVGYVPEDRAIFPTLTVAENLAMGFWRGGNEVLQATEAVLGYFPRLRDKFRARGATLSGGEQQMLSIGRALMGGPKILLVDEPTEGLAPVIVQALEQILQDLRDTGVSILVAESKLAPARRIASRIYVMGKGRTVFDGTPAELQDRQDIRREFLEI
jgi:branched-chain amino acid transport system ATP-binding protein